MALFSSKFLPFAYPVVLLDLLFHCVYCGIFENGVLLMYTLEGKGSFANFVTEYKESQ